MGCASWYILESLVWGRIPKKCVCTKFSLKDVALTPIKNKTSEHVQLEQNKHSD